jgi:hypothetical protein
MNTEPYQPKFTKDGKENPKYVDLLDEDKPIANQKFSCLSFVSPEKICKQKELFFMEKFLKQFEFAKTVDKYRQFLSFISHKYNYDFNILSSDLDEFVNEEGDMLKNTTIEDEYATFIDTSEERLEEHFKKEHGFQTSVRSVKVRGVFPTQEEAELRCKMLREVDPNHDIYVGPVGMWVPWHPEAYKTGKVEYMNEELNKLMYEKNKNDNANKELFDQRVKSSKETAISENIKIAENTGNKLTQNVDSEGNLFNTQIADDSINDIQVKTIRNELFNNDNIPTSSQRKN